jgi:predicted TIM-barrel fold metal-dependent hydrolase
MTKLRRRQFVQLAGITALGALLPACSEKPKLPAIPRFVDMHRHLLPGDLKDITTALQELDAWMLEKGVIQCVVPPVVWIKQDQVFDPEVGEALLNALHAYEDRIFGFISIHPLSKQPDLSLVEILRWGKKRGAKGFGEMKVEDTLFDDPAMMAVYAACEEVGLPVLFHLDDDNCIDDPGLPRLENALKTFPDLDFVAHGPGWWASISGDVTERKQLGKRPKTPVVPGGAAPRLLAEYPNLYADLSASSGLNGIRRDMDFGLSFIEQFQDKLMFGTDTVPLWFIPEWGHFDFYRELVLPGDVERKVYRDNARRVLDLPVPS